ncbi:hypothetical protein SAMN05216245_11322 [Succiniclasticum ruminis DSM 9236]|uniref:Uncharacterized protein n=1 Tax=Succiniclasticum ruminis DSM 9236 TaxID=1123323 RepID=A0A1I2CIP1_9FIRM|nr:hypothetical protein SAMN05216245_11322 [Succiniclasticum ruminis DSM 9236]
MSAKQWGLRDNSNVAIASAYKRVEAICLSIDLYKYNLYNKIT